MYAMGETAGVREVGEGGGGRFERSHHSNQFSVRGGRP